MKVTKSQLENIRVMLDLQRLWFQQNHRLAFNELGAFYFASGAARVLRYLGPEAEKLAEALQRSAMYAVIETLPPSVRGLIPPEVK